MTTYDRAILRDFDALFDEYNAKKITKEQMIAKASNLRKKLSEQFIKTGK